MKEIMMPVLVLDDDCIRCEYLDIECTIKSRIYAEEQCVIQDIQLKCKDLGICTKLMKRMQGRT